MQHFESHIDRSSQVAKAAASMGGILLLCWLAGCGTSINTASQPTGTTTANPQTYFAPYVAGDSNSVPQTFTIDDVKESFSQTIYQPLGTPGLQVLNAGGFSVGQRGLRSLGITANYAYSSDTGLYEKTTYPANAPEIGSFAVELAGQAGGLVQLVGQPPEPLVAATQCPSSSSAQTYQFVTIPNMEWNPGTDTAYGSASIVSSGSAVTFKNIQQYKLPSVCGTGASVCGPAEPSTPSVTGACGPTFFGSITNVPGQLVITDPGIGSAVQPAQAQIGISPTGLLVESNGAPSVMAGSSPPITYENVLGAGTGAVGLLKPSNPVDTVAAAGAQYLGFIYAAGEVNSFGSLIVPWSSQLTSFGFSSSIPSSGCLSAKASTSTPLIYGGDFPVNPATSLPDPGNSKNPNYPYGNCDFAIDLGQQDSSNNGFYPNAIVWVGGPGPGSVSGYAENTEGKTYSFPAVAIAGQLNIAGQSNGKCAIFVIGYDSTQPWAIYLLQSN
jgi:hypothetical protein